MKVKIIQLLLIISLFFNIAHDSVIAMGEQHINESVFEYVLEQQQGSECGNMGESHNIFHLTAILSSVQLDLESLLQTEQIRSETYIHQHSFQNKKIKPPIA